MKNVYKRESGGEKSRKLVIDFSVVFSFVIAVFSILSLSLFGIINSQGSRISYAEGLTMDPHQLPLYPAWDNDGQVMTNVKVYNGDQEVAFDVPLYLSDKNYWNAFFNLERSAIQGASLSQAITYTSKPFSEFSNFPQLLYVIKNSRAYGEGNTYIDDSIISSGNKSVVEEAWVTQLIIWDSLGKLTSDEIAKLKTVNKIRTFYAGSTSGFDLVLKDGKNFYDDVILPVVNQANTSKSSFTNILSISKAEGNVTKTSDGRYYQSPLITVTGKEGFGFNYYVINSDNDNVSFVDESGNTISSTVEPGSKFYVRIPVDKVTSATNITIGVQAYFNDLPALIYGADGKPDTISPDCKSSILSTNTDLEFVPAPSTGMSKTQMIYFIGLVVLLCGVGIVYANTKTTEAN